MIVGLVYGISPRKPRKRGKRGKRGRQSSPPRRILRYDMKTSVISNPALAGEKSTEQLLVSSNEIVYDYHECRLVYGISPPCRSSK